MPTDNPSSGTNNNRPSVSKLVERLRGYIEATTDGGTLIMTKAQGQAILDALEAQEELCKEYYDRWGREIYEHAATAADNAALRDALEGCVYDLEAAVNERYDGPDNVHPAMRPKYDLDMEPVTRARAVLEEK